MPDQTFSWRPQLFALLCLQVACADKVTMTSEDLEQCAGGTVTYGVDVSEFQGNIDWNAVKASGHDFAFIRVGDGFYFDPTFDQNWQQAADAHVARGAYQFFRPGEDGTAQANWFLQHVSGGEIAPTLDVEVTDGQSSATIVAGIAAWVARIEQVTGRTPIIYTAPGFWAGIGGAQSFGTTLWVAHWFTNCPTMPYSWNQWAFWQYSDNGSVPGIGAAVDEDVFNGSVGQLTGGGGTSVHELAFQANTTSLWTTGTEGTTDWGLGMMPGTNPSITALATGGFEVAFQANTGNLWTVGAAGNTDWGLGMMAGSSPSIAALPGGGFEVAFEANTTSLWTVGDAGYQDWGLGMYSGTSPSITALAGGGFEVAFEANTSSLWTVGTAGAQDWHLGMYAGTSPSIAAFPDGGFEVAFEANTTSLWTVGTAGNQDWTLGMYPGTNPSITALTTGGFEVAFQANTTSLWTVGNTGNNRDWGLGMYQGTSPSISALPGGGFEVTFEANTTSLWQAGDAGTGALDLGMYAGTSPSGT